MKKLQFLILALFAGLFSQAAELVLIPTGSLEKTKLVFSQEDLTVHFYNDRFAIGTATTALFPDAITLDATPWESGKLYYLLSLSSFQQEEYVAEITKTASVLHRDSDFMIVEVEEARSMELFPAIRGGMVRISDDPARLPSAGFGYKSGTLSARADIWGMLSQLDTANLRDLVQHLQDFGTRNAYKPGGIQAQNWIYAKFDSLGLDVELHDFSMPGGSASDNVIATLTGTKLPDEYVVLGAHYDSYAGGSNEPGADDNATGTAGILEIARILSQYEFDRSIVFCTWSGEEYGLYGSEAWATEAAQNGMNILGYFNIDMAGYLEPGSYIHTDLIGPASAGELKQFYKDVCAIYLPDFPIEPGALSGGDSDHTSFNNNGYQGIFPFEDSQDYSPYIHTANDVVDLSVNNFEQHGMFVKATLASVASMADMLPSPANLTGIAGDSEVILEWTGVDSVDHYNIYRNADPAVFATTAEVTFTDLQVTNGEIYTYYVTAVFINTGEESGPSNPVTVVPMPPIAFPFYDDFETGGPYWSFEGSWGLQNGIYHSASYAMTESPGGNYQPNLDISSTLRSIDLSFAESAEISFWLRHQLESDYDFLYLEVSTDGMNWDQLATYTGNQNSWIQENYSLADYIGNGNVILRFHFTSDVYIESQGVFIDDVEIDVVTGLGEKPAAGSTVIRIAPNPAGDEATINVTVPQSGMVQLYLADATGRNLGNLSNSWLNAGTTNLQVNLTGYEEGIYFLVMEANGTKTSKKLIISR